MEETGATFFANLLQLPYLKRRYKNKMWTSSSAKLFFSTKAVTSVKPLCKLFIALEKYYSYIPPPSYTKDFNLPKKNRSIIQLIHHYKIA